MPTGHRRSSERCNYQCPSSQETEWSYKQAIPILRAREGEDSRRYPKIDLVETSVQRAKANYFGRYIEQCVKAIPETEVKLAGEKGEPVALIIGSNPYRRQAEDYLVSVGLLVPRAEAELNRREQALEMLSKDSGSNLGWRLILADGDERVARERVLAAAGKNIPLVDVISASERKSVVREAEAWLETHEQGEKLAPAISSIKVTSFEGAKGMSAQYVFLIGLQSGDMPRNSADVQDIEICRFLVGMTRTKKVLHTNHRAFWTRFQAPIRVSLLD